MPPSLIELRTTWNVPQELWIHLLLLPTVRRQKKKKKTPLFYPNVDNFWNMTILKVADRQRDTKSQQIG